MQGFSRVLSSHAIRGSVGVGMTADDRFDNPPLMCDIVMKGGITSGVVYPGAVLALSERYRFASIGGASAGGIAAAITAAAEHGRATGGFDRIADLPGELAGTGPDGRPFMLQLFRPDPPTRRLFAVLLAVLQHGALGLLTVFEAFWRFPVVALAVALAAIGLAVLGPLSAALAVAGVFLAVVILVAGVVVDLVRAVRRLPANDFGLCRLGPRPGDDDAPALTGWLHRRIQETAGRGPGEPPLTFADLWAGRDEVLPDPGPERLERLVALSRNPRARAVDLQMMTTDLTHGRPMRLPVPYQRHKRILEHGGGLLFDPYELRRFFPGDVVDHLVAHAPATSPGTAEHLRRVEKAHLRHFPIGPDLPVVVATRMTLSFPVLISAIPLYELDFGAGDEPPLRRVLFSDGGITSNFPVHFFDSLLPTRPTFGLNLTAFQPGEAPDPADPCDAVRKPPRPSASAHPPAAPIDDLGGFATAIKDAAQNWRDNAQAELPGFRDRIVEVKLAPGEGGLNLTMDADKIRELNARGECAGRQLVELFAGDGTGKPEQWNDHRFVRYRAAMSLIERLMREYDRGYRAPADPVTVPYDERVAAGVDPPYPFTEESLRVAQRTTEGYLRLVGDWDDAGTTLDDARVPRPPSTLRVVPPV